MIASSILGRQMVRSALLGCAAIAGSPALAQDASPPTGDAPAPVSKPATINTGYKCSARFGPLKRKDVN